MKEEEEGEEEGTCGRGSQERGEGEEEKGKDITHVLALHLILPHVSITALTCGGGSSWVCLLAPFHAIP